MFINNPEITIDPPNCYNLFKAEGLLPSNDYLKLEELIGKNNGHISLLVHPFFLSEEKRSLVYDEKLDRYIAQQVSEKKPIIFMIPRNATHTILGMLRDKVGDSTTPIWYVPTRPKHPTPYREGDDLTENDTCRDVRRWRGLCTELVALGVESIEVDGELLYFNPRTSVASQCVAWAVDELRYGGQFNVGFGSVTYPDVISKRRKRVTIF